MYIGKPLLLDINNHIRRKITLKLWDDLVISIKPSEFGEIYKETSDESTYPDITRI